MLFGICFALIYGTAGQFMPNGFFGSGKAPTSDYLFFSFTTLTTVGFRETRPLGPGGEIFTISLILLTLSVALGDVTEGVDMALHEVAAEAVAHAEGAFEIDGVAGGELAEVGAA